MPCKPLFIRLAGHRKRLAEKNVEMMKINRQKLRLRLNVADAGPLSPNSEKSVLGVARSLQLWPI